jgi:hypothetical protein
MNLPQELGLLWVQNPHIPKYRFYFQKGYYYEQHVELTFDGVTFLLTPKPGIPDGVAAEIVEWLSIAENYQEPAYGTKVTLRIDPDVIRQRVKEFAENHDGVEYIAEGQRQYIYVPQVLTDAKKTALKAKLADLLISIS